MMGKTKKTITWVLQKLSTPKGPKNYKNPGAKI